MKRVSKHEVELTVEDVLHHLSMEGCPEPNGSVRVLAFAGGSFRTLAPKEGVLLRVEWEETSEDE